MTISLPAPNSNPPGATFVAVGSVDGHFFTSEVMP
jgi:hypothetical protein